MKFELIQRPKRPRPPMFRKGQDVRGQTVLDVVEYGNRGLSRNQWWYSVECGCGFVEDVSQSQLRQRSMCRHCARKINRPENRKKEWTIMATDELDFGRLKW